MTWNYCVFPEPNLDPPEYYGPPDDSPTEDELDELVDEAVGAAFKLWPTTAHIPDRSDIRDSGSRTYEDWITDWEDGPVPTVAELTPFLEALKEVDSCLDRLNAWEEPEAYECRCHKRNCAYCGDY
jgi:hypothetical protein